MVDNYFKLLFIAIISFLLGTFFDYKSIFFFLLFCYISSRNKSNNYLVLNCYLFYSFCGSTAAISYEISTGGSYTPYFDDWYYYDHVKQILEYYIVENSTLYEYVLTMYILPFQYFIPLKHIYFLPFNWFIGALVVNESIKLANHFYPNKNRSIYIISLALILFNANFTNGIVHLFRDGLMLLFLTKAINKAINKHYISSFVFCILTGFLRGANGLLALMFLFLQYFVNKQMIRKKNYVFIILTSLLALFLISDYLFDASKYIRSFSGNENNDTEGLVQSISERTDSFLEKGGDSSGIMKLYNSGNPIAISLMLPIYLVSPINIGPFIIIEDSLAENIPTTIIRFRIETIWEIINILIWTICIFPFFIGLYKFLTEKRIEYFPLAIYFIFTLILITYISMQHRHKMAFIIIYPLLYNCYKYYYKTNPKWIIILQVFISLLLLLYILSSL